MVSSYFTVARRGIKSNKKLGTWTGNQELPETELSTFSQKRVSALGYTFLTDPTLVISPGTMKKSF